MGPPIDIRENSMADAFIYDGQDTTWAREKDGGLHEVRLAAKTLESLRDREWFRHSKS